MNAEYIVIVDYNLTRFGDVKVMTSCAKTRHGIETILIRPNPQPYDSEVASVIIDLDPRGDGFTDKAVAALAPYRGRIRGVLPFSDNAVRWGAALAERLGCRADSSVLAQNAYSKISYRQSEGMSRELLEAQGLMVPRFAVVSTKEELEAFAASCPRGFVLKPSCEGNNRGVLRLDAGADLGAALEEVRPYLAEGLICEELITFREEFSFDGIGPLHFITEKDGVHGRYPVERGQIVPARRSARDLEAIARAGRAANLIVGQRLGPFHNEVKFDALTGRSAVIEPNRRPAGMRIWHLAGMVYGVNFFHMWIDQMMGLGLPKQLPEPRGVAAIRLLPSPAEGVLSTAVSDPRVVDEIFQRVRCGLPGGYEWFGFRFTAAPGASVGPVPKDNSGFIAEVSAFSADASADIKGALDLFQARFIEITKSLVAHNAGEVA